MIRGKETKLSKAMEEAGYPVCYQEKGWKKHCPTCIKRYKYTVDKLQEKNKMLKKANK